MTKENDNNAQPSSFRDQILRELEELKAQRLEGQPEETLSQVNDKVVEEIEAIASVAKNEICVKIKLNLSFLFNFQTVSNYFHIRR